MSTASVRKSARLTRTTESSTKNKNNKISNGQSRITEFVNVKKRATFNATDSAKKIVNSLDADETAVSAKPEEPTGTPVKIKRKQVKRDEMWESVKKFGVLTPSPSTESVTECVIEPSFTVKSSASVKDQCASVNDHFASASTSTSVEGKPAKVPAYKRFAHLIEGVRDQKVAKTTRSESLTSSPSEILTSISTTSPISSTTTSSKSTSAAFDTLPGPWLPLNDKWSFYEKLIFNVDSLCVLAAGRSQPCVFHKIQKTLENVLNRQVPIDQIERLNTLLPEAYEFRESRVIVQGRRVDSVALSVPGIGEADSSAALLHDRKEKVRGQVQKYLIESHAEEFEYSKSVIPKQWHDKFDQNKVADVKRTPLLESNALSLPDTPKLIKEIISSQRASPEKPSDPLKPQPTREKETQKMSLLERIRAKEQALQAKKCFGTFSIEADKLNAILSQMDRFTQSVMFTFSSAKKTSLFLTDLTTKLIQSSNIPLSHPEVLERLKMLQKCAPDWIKIVDEASNIGTGPKYVKIMDKTRSLTSILGTLKDKYAGSKD